MSKTASNLEIGHRLSGILKSQITDFPLPDFTISALTLRSSAEVRR